MSSKGYQTELQKLQERYLASLPSKINALEKLLLLKDRQKLAESFHKLKGSGKTYGFSDVTEIAKLVDQHYKMNSKDYFQWAEVAIRLLQTLHKMMEGGVPVSLKALPDYQQLLNSVSNSTKGDI